MPSHLTKKQIQLLRRHSRIKSLVYEAGWTFSRLDRHYDLPRGAVQDALRNPNEGGEKAIADVLEVHPKKLWTDRYDQHTGHRHSPQPHENYTRPPTLAERRKIAGAQT